MRKGILIGFGVVGVLGVGLITAVVLLVWGIFAATRPVVDASEQFLALLGQGRVAEAYVATADEFRGRQDEGSFTRAVDTSGLTEFASVSWHSRRIDNHDGVAEGSVTTKAGDTRPIAVRLVHEGGKWKVAGVRYRGLELTAPPPAVPPAEELRGLVTNSLLAFSEAVQPEDFVAFHADLADVWKKETTPERLRAVFREFIDKRIDIAGIRNVEPQIAPPAVSETGVLTLAGHYPTRPSQVRFELEYRPSRLGWKLSGVALNVGKADAAE